MNVLKKLFKKRDKIIPNYPLLISSCEIDIDKISQCQMIVDNLWKPRKERYMFVSKMISIPAWLIFAIHYKESSCSFKSVLHNGEKIVGTNKKTFLVPKGRGPFDSWEDSAIDALMLKQNIFPVSWENIPACLEFCERYNGLGHRNAGKLSPYIWAYTNNHNEKGNFVSDGKYDSEVKIKSAGIASILITLEKSGEIELTYDRKFSI